MGSQSFFLSKFVIILIAWDFSFQPMFIDEHLCNLCITFRLELLIFQTDFLNSLNIIKIRFYTYTYKKRKIENKVIVCINFNIFLIISVDPRYLGVSSFTFSSQPLCLFLHYCVPLYLLALALLSGDIQLNPGPVRRVKYPCGVCDKAVKNNQHGIFCDSCIMWFHCSCVGLSFSQYTLIGQSSSDWSCFRCALPNFSDSFFCSPSDLDHTSTSTPGPPTCTNFPISDVSATSRLADASFPSFLLANVRSIKNKLRDLEFFISKNKYNIVALTETWLDSSVLDSELFSSDFVVFRSDRSSRGGGVLLSLHQDLSPEPLLFNSDILNLIVTFDLEIVFTKCKTRHRSILLCCVYCPPPVSAVFSENLSKFFYSITDIIASFDIFMLMGDFNMPLLHNFNLPNPTPTVSVLQDCLSTFNLTQVVTSPTRQDHFLDLIFINDTSFINNVAVVDNLPGCDHSAVQGTILCPKARPRAVRRCFYDYRNADILGLNAALASAPWWIAFGFDDIDDIWFAFKSIFFSCVNEFIPLKQSSRRHRNPWITKEIIHLSNIKRTLFKKLKSNRSISNLTNYRNICNKIKATIRKSYLAYINNLALNIPTCPRRFWSFVHNKKNLPPPVNFIDPTTNSSFTSSKVIASAFNNFFYSCFKPSNPIPDLSSDEFEHNPSIPDLSFVTVCPDDIFNAFKTCSKRSAAGPDLISPAMLNICIVAIVDPLCKFFNLSLASGNIPSDWKNGNVVPILKSGSSRSEISSYRPISLTSIVGKLLERIVLSKILPIINLNNLLPPSQFGFRPGFSCSTQLVQAYHSWASSLDLSSPPDVHVVLFDWKKAFDSVPHDLLILKLSKLGFSGSLLSWFSSFLSDRFQRVVFQGHCSDYLPVLSGVPQGSILGPILFNLFVSDLSKDISSSFWQYADDSYLSRPIFSPSDSIILQSDINSIQGWGVLNGLDLNINKCSFMIITRRRSTPSFQYYISGLSLPRVFNVKILGIYISSDLKWDIHINKVCLKARRIIGLIIRTLGHSPASIVAFKTLVLPILNYCSSVWSPFLSKDISRLEGIQRSFTRYYFSRFSHSNTTVSLPYHTRLSRLGLLSLSNRRLINDLIFLFKLINAYYFFPDLLNFLLINDRHSILTFSVKFSRCNSLKFSFFSRVVPAWNSLPDSILTCSSLTLFRKSLSDYFCN